jgi:hypothetical protein
MQSKLDGSFDGSSEDIVDQNEKQTSSEAKEPVTSGTETTEQNTAAEPTVRPATPPTQARNANSFFAGKLLIPCPGGASDHLHIYNLDGLELGVVFGEERDLSILAMMSVLKLAMELSSEEDNSNTFGM